VIGIILLMHEKNYDQVLKIFEQFPPNDDIILDFLEATARYNIKNKTHAHSGLGVRS